MTLVALLTLLSITMMAHADPINVLIITGKNNHNWQATTESLKMMYLDSGMFTVETTTEPSTLDAPTLEKYDVLVNNWTRVGESGHLWGEETEKAIEAFVAGGKGFVAFHAGSSCFFDWPAFHKMVGGTWGKGTGHGKMHQFKVTVTEYDHPITRGLSDFETTDELWHKIAVLHPVDSRKVLCQAFSSKESGGSGQMEDVAVCTQFGKGRGFYSTLGHDVKCLSNPGTTQLMLRATQWAATGKVTIGNPVNIDALLAKVALYDDGQNREHLLAFEKTVQNASTNPAQRSVLAEKISKLLGTPLSMACKTFLCWQLSLVATDNEIPVLENLLSDETLSDHARNGLVRLATPPARSALLKSLKTLKGQNLLGTISALGQLKETTAVSAIGAYINDKDKSVAYCAIEALGAIGNGQAQAILKNNESKLSGYLKTTIYEAQLKCADSLIKSHDTKTAKDICLQLIAADKPASIRTAAFMTLAEMPDENTAERLTMALSSTDSALHRGAITCLRGDLDKNTVTAVAKNLTLYASPVQVNVINALAATLKTGTLTEIKKLETSQNNDVKIAVLNAIGLLGDQTDVSYLVAKIPASNDLEKQAIKNSLTRLHGDGINDALIAELSNPDKVIRKTLIPVIGARGITKASASLLKIAWQDSQNRQDAIKVLGSIAGEEILDDLVKLLDKVESNRDRITIERAMIEIISRENGADSATMLFCAKFDNASKTTKIALLHVLAKLGGPTALKTTMAAADNPDRDIRLNAIRSMAAWKDSTPMMPLLEMAQKTDDSLARILAMRGFAGLAAQTDQRPTEKIIAVFEKLLQDHTSLEIKKPIVDTLGKLHSKAALKMAVSLLDDTTLKEDAASAAMEISAVIYTSDSQEVRQAIKKVLSASKNPKTIEKTKTIQGLLDKP